MGKKFRTRASVARQLGLEALETRRLLSAAAVLDAVAHPTFRLAHRQGMTPAGSVGPTGLMPAQMRHAYGIDSISFDGIAGDGAGQTIAIVDAYDDPNAASDLQNFDSAFGLPDPPSFTKLNENGGTTLPGIDTAAKPNTWELEEMLDIEWAHVIAPAANIILYEANSPSYSDLVVHAVNSARNNPSVTVVSMSFGGGEFLGETSYDTYFTTPSGHNGVSFLASTGDSGSPGGYPAYSSNVIAVGGTTLSVDSTGNYLGENAWSGSGGGRSTQESEPSYQTAVQSSGKRGIPDVAMDADPNSGVPVYDTFDNGTSAPWIQVGGTSLAAPMWAGLIAIANQGRIHNGLSTLDGRNQALPALYQASSSNFHDVISGSNGGFSAGAGYDFVTGRGTPIADLLVAALAGGSVANVPPVVQTLSASPNPVTAGNDVTLSASGVSDSDGTVTSLSFYRESNGIAGLQSGAGGDTVLGADTDGSDGWTNISSTTGLSGTYTFYAQAQDNSGAFSAAASTTDTITTSTINQPPIIQSLSGSPNPVSGGANLTLTASGVSDPDGSVLSVWFYRESNGIAGLQSGSGGDTLLGNDTSGLDGWTNVSASSGLNGTYTYYAQAQDDGGALSGAVSTNVRVKKNPGHFAVIAVASSSIGSDNLVTTSMADLLGFKPSKSLFSDQAIA